MRLFPFLVSACLAIVAVACGPASDVEIGPYTVSVIGKNVYHIQDCNSANPAGETFDAEGKRTHFNNCSDMYLLVGAREALLIDLSNPIDWADGAGQALRSLVEERTEGKGLTIAFTHDHGDHTGMIPAFIEQPNVKFALPLGDFSWFPTRYPDAQARFIDEGETFNLGGMEVEAIAVPGHTDGSMVYLLKERNLLFTGDAVGSGHGVWIFDAEGFEQYVSAVPHLIETLEARGVDPDRLVIYGGHSWQKDWLEGREPGMAYLKDMQELVREMEAGTAATEPSNLGRPGLDTYFRHGDAIVTWSAAGAEKYRSQYPEPVVYRDGDVVFRKIDDHTWVGNGHLVYNESIYLLEGTERALLIDAGAWMPRLPEAVATLTDKPVTLVLTHGHGDHVGAATSFPEVWINPADTALLGTGRNGHEEQIRYLSDGQVFDLGGRKVDVLFTPGHTSGSTTLFDREGGYGFSGDSFGSTNLLLFGGTFRELAGTIDRTLNFMKASGIDILYPGHYHGDNPETVQRLQDEKKMVLEVLSGKRKGIADDSGNGLDHYIHDYGVYIRYNEADALR